MAIKKANEKQIKLLESLIRKSKYELTGKRLEDLNSVECSVLIDFFMNDCNVKTINADGTPIDEFFLRKNRILIEDTLTFNEDKVVGAASPRALSFLKKLTEENKYDIIATDEELTAKIVYQLTNHLLNKEPNQEVADKYLRDTLKENDKLSTIDPLDNLNDIDFPEVPFEE